jgi:hypothetical protein
MQVLVFAALHAWFAILTQTPRFRESILKKCDFRLLKVGGF